MEDIRRIIESQIEKSRNKEAGVKILEDAFKQKSKPLHEQVREFHKKFIETLVDELMDKHRDYGDCMSRWHKIFKNPDGVYVSYYRKDSYLLADAPFIFKPAIAFLKPKREEYEAYYGVGPEGVKLLIKNHVLWPEVLHISAYENLNLVKKVSEDIIPYYIDSLEDSLAVYWIENIVDNSKLDASMNDKIRSYKEKYNKKDFKYFIYNIYLSSVKEKYPDIISLYENLPPKPSQGAPPLRYKSLRDAVIERLLKVSLFYELLSKLNNDEKYLEMSSIISELKNELKSDINNYEEIGYYIYKFWQAYGTFWSYSEGNLVDFSARDIFPRGFKYTKDSEELKEKIKSFEIKLPNEVFNVIQNTDIDDMESINQYSRVREEYIRDFFERSENRGYIDGYDWIIRTRRLSMENRNILNERIEDIYRNNINGDGTGTIFIGFTLNVCSLYLDIFQPNNEISSYLSMIAMLIDIVSLLRIMRNIKSAQLKSIDGKETSFRDIPLVYGNTGSPESLEDFYRKSKENFKWKMHLISLPYQRKYSPEFSNEMVYAVGN